MQNVTQTANTMKQTDEVERALDYCHVGLVSESFGRSFTFLIVLIHKSKKHSC